MDLMGSQGTLGKGLVKPTDATRGKRATVRLVVFSDGARRWKNQPLDLFRHVSSKKTEKQIQKHQRSKCIKWKTGMSIKQLPTSPFKLKYVSQHWENFRLISGLCPSLGSEKKLYSVPVLSQACPRKVKHPHGHG